MPRVVTPPFAVPSSDIVVAESWQTVIGGKPVPLPSVLAHWDYNTDIPLIRSVSIDTSEVRRACGLNARAPLNFAVTWRSIGNNVRGLAAFHSLVAEIDQFTLNGTVPGLKLADSVTVTTQLLLGASIDRQSPISPAVAGSVLWSDAVNVRLEGSASRFPIEIVDFNAANWAPYKGAWYLWWNSDQLEQPFLRNVRLFINSSNSAAIAAVQAAEPTPDQAIIRSAIYYDVGRMMLRGALLNEEFVAAPHSFAEGSTGLAVFRLLNALFPGETPAKVRSLMIERPEYFDSLLQGTLQLFE